MADYQLEQVSFTYPQGEAPALQQITLSVHNGDFVLVGGSTGSGKTTLLRLLKKQVQPAGHLTGTIKYNGDPLSQLPDRRSAEEIGMVFQDPDNQIVMTNVWQELCHGMENLGYPPVLMQKRMAEVVPYFGMEGWLHQTVETLSGGQKQILNLASVMMLRPKVLLLDEPTAQLDPIAAGEFIDMLVRINQELSVTVILCEHRLEGLYSHANRVLLMEDGKIACSGTPESVVRQIWHHPESNFSHYLPSVSRLYLQLENSDMINESVPLTVKDGKRWFNCFYSRHSQLFSMQQKPVSNVNRSLQPPLLQCRDLTFQYEPKASPVLRRLSMEIQQKDFFVLLGGNGSGKSTLLKLIAGVLPHQQGDLIFQQNRRKRMKPVPGSREIGYVAQNPMAYFTGDTVGELLTERKERLSLTDDSRLKEIIQWFQLEPLLSKHPFDLSGGQQQLVVLALVLMADPALLLMDEPTRGLDPVAKNQLAWWIHRLREQGRTILMVSHDIEFAASHATRCGLLFDGDILAVEEPDVFFSENYYYTTMIHRTVRDCLAQEITEEGVVSRWVKHEI